MYSADAFWPGHSSKRDCILRYSLAKKDWMNRLKEYIIYFCWIFIHHLQKVHPCTHGNLIVPYIKKLNIILVYRLKDKWFTVTKKTSAKQSMLPEKSVLTALTWLLLSHCGSDKYQLLPHLIIFARSIPYIPMIWWTAWHFRAQKLPKEHLWKRHFVEDLADCLNVTLPQHCQSAGAKLHIKSSLTARHHIKSAELCSVCPSC